MPFESNDILVTPGVYQRKVPKLLSICQFCAAVPLKKPTRGLRFKLPAYTPDTVVVSLNGPLNCPAPVVIILATVVLPLTVKLLCTAPVDKILPAVLITPDTFIVPPVYAAALTLPLVLIYPAELSPVMVACLANKLPINKLL